MPPVVRAEPAADRPAGGAPDPTVPAISLRGLRKEFAGGVVAVQDLDLDVAEGEFVTLLGPSGSGKTTVLRLIAGFEQPTAGRVALRGRDVTGVPPFDRDVHTVFQDYALFPHLSVLRNVEYPLRIAKVGRAERRERALAGAGHGAVGGDGRARPDRAVRRPAATGGAGPGAGRPARGAAARRAPRRAGPEAARADAGRAQADPAGVRDHVRAGHPRPGRGAHAGRPGGGVQRGPGRAGRAGGRGLRAAGDGVRGRLRRHLQRARAGADRSRRDLERAPGEDRRRPGRRGRAGRAHLGAGHRRRADLHRPDHPLRGGAGGRRPAHRAAAQRGDRAAGPRARRAGAAVLAARARGPAARPIPPARRVPRRRSR